MFKTRNTQNYALIDSRHIEFDKGFSAVSVEIGINRHIFYNTNNT